MTTSATFSPAQAAELAKLGPFKRMKNPTKVGQLKAMTWKAPFVHGVNQVWANRCRDYWDLQERTYGVIYSDHRNAYDEMTSTITTFATVLAIVPGERYDGDRVH